MIGFGDVTAALEGATVTGVRVKLKNMHTFANNGGTAYVGLHGRASNEETWGFSVQSATNQAYAKGSSHEIKIPSAYWGGFITGSYRGITLYTNVASNARYGYWDGSNAELIIDYRK
ncbi:hypothetical protein EJ997_10305 [Flaviflexus ciconiae]|uniref:Uncharacterized protein n=1 Tax=Flaviflexus ciconiae TaxID=2496867 RepID=A0A3S9PZ80_9ACTO|nr:hypothetical protein [Flaviflexus ciconiae]AZQ77675.1 hypothetical protein EJ997_10305 [Flaviflexus ciconiae]